LVRKRQGRRECGKQVEKQKKFAQSRKRGKKMFAALKVQRGLTEKPHARKKKSGKSKRNSRINSRKWGKNSYRKRGTTKGGGSRQKR